MSEVQKVTKKTLSELLAETDSNVMHTLRNSVYPGAKDESIGMVIAYCTAKKYDLVAKAVHIVPMSVKNAQTGQYEWRDVIMPGISSYRIDADRTGLYLGLSEPEYGPEITENLGGREISYPEWCKITVKKFNKASNQSIEFTAKEYWKENYATKGKDKTTGVKSTAPNEMWEKRPKAQLAKCCEAQALRKAFPDVLGGMVTFEEMEGKEIKDITGIVELVENTSTIDAEHLAILREKMEQAESKEMAICTYLKIDCLESMLAKDFSQVIRQLNQKIKLKKKTDTPLNKLLADSKTEEVPVTEEAKDYFGDDL